MAAISGLLSEKERLQIKELADETRKKWSKKGYFDIFTILDHCSILIRRPLKSNFSGFSTFLEEEFIVVLNTNYTLGHERFTGAHELYHLMYNQDVLRRENLILFSNNEEEYKAQGFAAELLLPEDGVKDSFFKVVGETIATDKVEARHVVRMQHIFQVSYAAMLKRLIQLNLCAVKRYDFLRDYGKPERTDELQQITIREGYEINLISPSKITSISDEYIQATRSNFEKKNISYAKLFEVLAYVGKTPQEYGHEPYGEEDCNI